VDDIDNGRRLPRHPFLYEIDTWPWLTKVSAATGRRVDLGSVPDTEWDRIAGSGFDAVWLMGVWQRSPAGVAIALGNDSLRSSFDEALPAWSEQDVVGSPYCVRDYVVDDALGGRRGLAAAREALAMRGVKLVLDFVPNHVAPDHPWTRTHPERFVLGSSEDLTTDPSSFVEVGGRVLANGRDPYFPAWPDVVQLNAFAPALREAAVATLRDIADQCDGVRCDMAMLMMNDVFAKTWGSRAGDAPAEDYWPTVIDGVRQRHPNFVFVAEAYWDLEWELQQHGFDYCYDKRLYDRIVQGDAEEVRRHLLADDAYQQRLVRFVENHDEPRTASIFDGPHHRAAVVAALTQTGARLVHDGQQEGRRTHLPVFLGRYPDEPVDAGLVSFYDSLLAALRDPTFREGTWRLCERTAWPGNDSAEAIVTWCWDQPSRWLIAVNLSPATAAAQVRVPWPDLAGQRVRLVDPTHHTAYDRSGDDLVTGLYVELGPWDWHLFRFEPIVATEVPR